MLSLLAVTCIHLRFQTEIVTPKKKAGHNDPTSSFFKVPFLDFDGTRKAELHLSALYLAFLDLPPEACKTD